MARSKKTRKGGDNGPTLAPRVKKKDRNVIEGKRSENGRKSGGRHNETLLQQQGPNAVKRKNKDPRHGSKKPVSLGLPTSVAEPLKVKTPQPKLSDEQKLLKLEEDPRLNSLLDMLEEGRELPANDQQWLDQQLTKIEALLTKLGITDADDMPAPKAKAKSSSDDDLLARFESGADLLKDYLSKD
jgi:ribosome assembly protein YihI (activator of Der GTPase)